MQSNLPLHSFFFFLGSEKLYFCFNKVSGTIFLSVVCLKNNHWLLIIRLEVKNLSGTIAVRQRYLDSFVCTIRAYTVKKASDFPVPSRDVTYQTLPGHAIDASNSWASTAGAPPQGRQQKQ
jgi:hypothetical protein